ncbi:hypothetical protein ACF0H5_014853 [Mactra antiquata]
MADGTEELTQKIKAGLERLGYSKQRATLRSTIYGNASLGTTIFHSQVNKYQERLTVVITGSHREGMAGFWQSDTDQLIIPQSVSCVEEHTKNFHDLECKTVFILDYKGAPEGYVFLKCHKIEENTPYTDIIKNDCFDKDGELFLANNRTLADITNIEEHTPDLFKKHEAEKGVSPDLKKPASDKMLIKLANEKRHGPARPFTLRIPVLGYQLAYDNVIAFKCYSLHLNQWCDSKLQARWPDVSTIDKIRKLDTYVVPIGVEGTDHESLQWRISHALAEVELVSSFNDIQIKVYGLLKLAAKTILEKPLEQMIENSDDVPSLSYMVKNVMFWISEEETTEGFTDELFVDRVQQAIQKLLLAMETGQLPCYMFPSRNICTKKFTDEFRRKLSEELKTLLKEGISMVKRIPELKEHIEVTDSRKLDEKAKRRLIEEYFFLAPFTLPPEHMADVKQQFLTSKWSLQAVRIYFKEVWPYFIKNVTDDMFDDFNDRSDIRKFIHIVSEYIGLRNFFRYIKQICVTGADPEFLY